MTTVAGGRSAGEAATAPQSRCYLPLAPGMLLGAPPLPLEPLPLVPLDVPEVPLEPAGPQSMALLLLDTLSLLLPAGELERLAPELPVVPLGEFIAVLPGGQSIALDPERLGLDALGGAAPVAPDAPVPDC